jgi:asparagine synthase (glutamine-hydrolysing)
MCGIAGIINKSGAPVDRGILERMTERARHRGPDGVGYEVSGNVGLGHRRLAIIDLSDGGSQPMHSGDGRLTITFNGEIYNYLEVREELRSRGHRFLTSSDTEVILAAYAEWGEDCVCEFNGMWAFAIHDRERQVVYCSRDRFGVKPFYFVDNERQFGFASEIKQLLELMPTRRANRNAVASFLADSILDDSEDTFFEAVHKLLPGHQLTVDLRSGVLRQKCWYKLQGTDLHAASPEELEQRFLELLESAVTLRLRSDVPVGSCLSGGLDSSSIVSIAAERHRQRSSRPFAGLTAISCDAANDESHYARTMVEHCGMQWLTFTPAMEDFAATMAEVSYAQDEPFAGPSTLMGYFVMRMARERGVTVLLDGQGADETLLGYPYYFGFYFNTLLRDQGPRAALAALRQSLHNNSRLSRRNAVKYMFSVAMPWIRHGKACWDTAFLRRTPGMPETLRELGSHCDLANFQISEIMVRTLPALLRYEDRNSMAFGVETRLPFMDFRLVEFCVGLPLAYKIRDGWSKWILRKAMSTNVPTDVIWRKDKIGFEAPESIWINDRQSEVRQTVLRSPLVRAISREGKLKRSYSSLAQRVQWRLYSLAVWAEQFGIHEAQDDLGREIEWPRPLSAGAAAAS